MMVVALRQIKKYHFTAGKTTFFSIRSISLRPFAPSVVSHRFFQMIVSREAVL